MEGDARTGKRDLVVFFLTRIEMRRGEGLRAVYIVGLDSEINMASKASISQVSNTESL